MYVYIYVCMCVYMNICIICNMYMSYVTMKNDISLWEQMFHLLIQNSLTHYFMHSLIHSQNGMKINYDIISFEIIVN